MADPREEFSEKVLAKLKEMNKAVDLTEEASIANVEQAVQEIIAEQRQEIISIKSEDFTALGTTTQGGGSGSGPASGGSKDILIIPGFGGTSSDTTSQINFYWDTGFGTSGYTTASGNPPSTNTDTGKRTSIFNYASGTTAPVLVFGGYTGTTYYAPSTSYGGSVNATVANIWINPFTGQIDTNYINFNNGVATSTTQGVISWSTTDARLAIGTGTVTKFLAYTTDVTSANQITATTDGADVDMYALFVNNLGDGSTNQTVKTGTATSAFVYNATNGNVTFAGDIAVNGGDITTTSASASLFNTNATTLSIGGAAATFGLGSTTGTLTLSNPTVATGTTNLTLFNTNAATINAFGAATALNFGSSTGTLTLSNPTVATGTTNLTLFNTNAATINAFGAGTAISLGANTGTLTLSNPTVATGTTNLTLFNTNAATISAFGAGTAISLGANTGTLTLSNPTVATGTTSLTLFNTVATTVSAFGAGTAISLGANTGTLTLSNPTVATGTTNLTLFNTVATTVSAFGAATALSLGSSSGTATIANTSFTLSNATNFNATSIATLNLGSAVTGASTYNIGSGAVTSATKTINIGTGGLSGGTTNITIGTALGTGLITLDGTTITTNVTSLNLFNSNATTLNAFQAGTAISLGSTTGTATIRNATVAFSNATNITGLAGSLTLLGEPTTLTAFGGVTTGTLFGTTATATLNFASGALASGSTKTINIGTGGVATSTTVITIGNTLNAANSTISFSSNRLQNVADPSAAQDAATKNYVDNAIQGLDVHDSVQAMFNATISTSITYFQQYGAFSTSGFVIGTSYIEANNNGALSTTLTDGITLTAGTVTTGSRVLIAFGVSTTSINYSIAGTTAIPSGGTSVINGVYALTNAGGASAKWRFDRALDTNDNIELVGGTFMWVQQGATYGDSGWLCTNDTTPTPLAIGGDAINFTQFSGAGQISAGAGLTKSGNTLDVGAGTGITVNADSVQISATYIGQGSITTLGTVTVGGWNASLITLAYGGTNTSSYPFNNSIVYYDNTNSKFSSIQSGANTTVLIGQGTTSVPAFGQLNLTSMVTGLLPVTSGGTGTSTFTANGVLYGNAGTSILVTAASAATGAILAANTNAAPSFTNTLSGTYTFSNSTEATNTTTAAVVFTKGIAVGSASYLSDTYHIGAIFNAINATTMDLGTSAATRTFNIGTGGTTGNSTVINIGTAAGTSSLALNSPTITTGTTSLTLFNTNAATINAFGAGTAISLGANTGTLTLSNPTVATGTTNLTLFNTNAATISAFGAGTAISLGANTGTLTLSNPTVATGTTNLTLFNTVATTVSAFGAATALSLGSSSGTATIANTSFTLSNATNFNATAVATVNLGSAVTGASTYNIGSGAVTSATKTINIGTGGNTGGTTLITLGTSVGTSTITLLGTISPAIAIGSGGTGTSSFTATDKTLVYYDTAGSGKLANISSAGNAGQALISGGAGVAPSWGTLGGPGGGTGSNSYFTANGVVYASSTTALATGSVFTWIPGTTTGTTSSSALYASAASVTTGTAMYLSATSMTSGNALIINAGNGSFTSGKLIDAQNQGNSKFSVDFNGNLRATTKSFDIEHPTKPGKRLVYGVLEGPEHGVYHRGTIEGKGLIKVELPEYWYLLVGENYSVQLTAWGNYSVHVVDKSKNYFTIQLTGNIIAQKYKNIKVDYIIHGSRIDAPLEIEQE